MQLNNIKEQIGYMMKVDNDGMLLVCLWQIPIAYNGHIKLRTMPEIMINNQLRKASHN